MKFIYKTAPLSSWKGSLNTSVIPKAVLQPAATASSLVDFQSHTFGPQEAQICHFTLTLINDSLQIWIETN